MDNTNVINESWETKAIIEKGISKKNGSEYYKVNIALTPTYTHSVFLQNAEKEIFRLYVQSCKLPKEQTNQDIVNLSNVL